MLTGTTVFLGDSITIGLPPFVAVKDGARVELAIGGASSDRILRALRAAEADGRLSHARNLVTMAGTNDLASGFSVAATLRNLEAMWAIGHAHGLRVVALTVPPAKGAVDGAGRLIFDAAALARRLQINAAILASPTPDRKVDLDAVMGDPSDHEKLAPQFDCAKCDHLHPRRDVMGAALTLELANDPPAPPPPAGESFGGVVVVGIALAIGGVVAWLVR